MADRVLRVGNVEVVREFTDVRDVVRAYIGLMRATPPAACYNIASGTGYPLKRALELLLDLATVEMVLEVDPTRIRAADPAVLVGDPSKLQELTGWAPEIALERSISDILDHWRREVSP